MTMDNNRNNNSNNNSNNSNRNNNSNIKNTIQRRNKFVAFGILGVIGLGLLFPLYYITSKQDKPKIEKYSKGSAVRGSFLNSGSTDIGKDSTRYKNNYEEHKRKMIEKHYNEDNNNNNNNNENNNKN
ncbi:hypothetical protein ACTFIU_000734 [Dictyostelium citrinum]